MEGVGGTQTSSALDVDVWRGDRSGGAYQSYRVPRRANQTVLDVVSLIQREIDATLTYRFACRVGMCGSCAMMVNDRPRWTCRTHVGQVERRGRLKLAPLRNLPVIRDLAADMTEFFDKWQRARGRFSPDDRWEEKELEAVLPKSRHRAAANAAVECINCAVCYSACDVVAQSETYLGPAALNRAWVAYNDIRDADREAVLEATTADGGCQSCHSHQSCAQHCPVGLDPTHSIAGLKRAFLLSRLLPEWGA